MKIDIREATGKDFEAIWPIFQEIVKAGDTYAYDPLTSMDEAYEIWMIQPFKTYVATENETILGTYYLKPNQPYLGKHVCNCGYMVCPNARGKGVATLMCEHSQEEAIKYNFKAMQYNLVVSCNEGAIRLWERLGFEILATLPKAFNHKELGLVDAFVMYKWLEQ